VQTAPACHDDEGKEDFTNCVFENNDLSEDEHISRVSESRASEVRRVRFVSSTIRPAVETELPPAALQRSVSNKHSNTFCF
jgi:hypothetical protein